MFQVKIAKETGRGLGLVLLFCILYTLCVNHLLTNYYYVYYTPVISYEKSFSAIRFCVSLILCLGLYIFTQTVSTKKIVIDYSIRVLYVVYCLPSVMSFGLFEHRYSLSFLICICVYWCAVVLSYKFISFSLNAKIKFGGEDPIQLPKKARQRVFFVLVVLLILYMIKSMPSFSLSLSLENVYETRAMFKEGTNDVITSLKSAFGTFLLPCMIVKFYKEQKKEMMLLVTFFQMIMFSLAKDKVYLLFLCVAYGIAFFHKALSNKAKMMNYTLLGINVIFILALLGVSVNLFFNMFIRRFCTVPSWLNYIYYDFFLTNEKLWWRQDTFLVDKIFSPVYEKSVPLVIGEQYFAGLVSNPNAGLFAEAFSRCGFFGVIVYPLLLTIVLNVVQLIYKHADKTVLIMLSFSLSLSIINDLITSTSFVCVMVILFFFSFMFEDKTIDLDIGILPASYLASIKKLKRRN